MLTDYAQPRARHELNNKLCALAGQSVTGQYCGQAFTGLVDRTRGITTRPYDIELTIRLSSPITVFGTVRDGDILISAGSLIDALYTSSKHPTYISGVIPELDALTQIA